MRAHVLVCRGPDCSARGAQEVYTAVAWEIERQGLSDEVVQTQSGCVGPLCGGGPVVCCYPTGAWYAPGGARRRGRDRGARPRARRGRPRAGRDPARGSGVNHTDAFDEMLAEQPSDWATFEVYLTLDDPLRLNEARVALARANARPLRVPGRPRLRDHRGQHARPRRARGRRPVGPAHPRRPRDQRPHLGGRDPNPGPARPAPPLRPLEAQAPRWACTATRTTCSSSPSSPGSSTRPSPTPGSPRARTWSCASWSPTPAPTPSPIWRSGLGGGPDEVAALCGRLVERRARRGAAQRRRGHRGGRRPRPPSRSAPTRRCSPT